MMNLEEKLRSLGIQLPSVPGPILRLSSGQAGRKSVYVAGQLPMKDGKLIGVGQVPSRCSIEQARQAARQCVINGLAAVKAVAGSFDDLAGVSLRCGVFVSSDPTFTEQPKVANSERISGGAIW